MVSNVIRAVMHGSGVGEEFAFGWYAQCDSALTTEAQLSDIADAWDDNMNTSTTPSCYAQMLAQLSNDQKLDTLSLYYYSTLPGSASFLHHKTISKSGTVAVYQPLQQALVVTTETDRSGSSYRGRFYLPATGIVPTNGHLLSATALGQVATGGLQTIVNFMDALRASPAGDGSRAVVYSPTKGLVTPITSMSIDNKFDVQRRRAMSQVGTRTTYPGPNG
uniref:Uncharacterized protein n=1 Tax=uncultured prokaryote TaxID=198431 RepID=A0A0H5Q5Q2_9ZZZZ|nr:hypothetical protein [uncultured prokaryote]